MNALLILKSREEIFATVDMAVLDLWRSKAGDSAIRRLARKVGRIDRLVRVDSADRNGRPPEIPGPSPQGMWISERAEKLRVKDSAPEPILKGRHLMEMGYSPSPIFGDALEAAYEAQLDGKFFNLEEGLEYFRKNIRGKFFESC